MGREIRKVPKNWEHPTDDNGRFIPLYDTYYLDELEDWLNNHRLWLEGKHPDQARSPEAAKCKFYAEWSVSAPDVNSYRTVAWTEEEACCFQMYENVSEGTPVSPVFESLQGLEDWLVSKGHTRHAAQSFCKSGYAPSFAFSAGRFKSNIDTYDL